MAFDVEGLFHRHRQARERRGFRPRAPGFAIEGARAFRRRVEIEHAERIQSSVVARDARGIELEQLQRADFLRRAQRADEPGRRPECDVHADVLLKGLQWPAARPR